MSIVRDQFGNREHGFYHRMKLDEFLAASGLISANLAHWGVACAGAGESCGKLYHVGGAGRGTMHMQHQIGGPFRT